MPFVLVFFILSLVETLEKRLSLFNSSLQRKQIIYDLIFIIQQQTGNIQNRLNWLVFHQKGWRPW